MAKTPQARFVDARDKILTTAKGQEAAMYAPLHTLFVEVLGYPSKDVDIDIAGKRGRPDLTVFAPGAVDNAKVSWIVLEAKDAHGVCLKEGRRATLFAEKSKYITADTAWFVMVDPTTIVARPADKGENAASDIVLDLASLTYDEFLDRFAALKAEVAGVPQRLARFREGDLSLIDTDALSGSGDTLAESIARNAFYDGLEDTTRQLQAATLSALTAIRAKRNDLKTEVDAFSEQFHGHVFKPYPVSVEGHPKGREETIEHGRAVHTLNRTLAANPALSRLTLSALPAFAERTGIDPDKEADKLDRFFATETANLILARILLIRFLEGHSFFDLTTPDGTQMRRYLCNGGVAAFQGMRDYFDAHYTRLLEDAYRQGAQVYAAAFRETEHDWVLDLSDDTLSRTIEWAMFRFARFDFTTIRGDILTGIYDRFLDPAQRKALGEYYSPPSIARYMLDRLDLAPEDTILDPACGSGTFLIERYQQAVGEDADRGLATYSDACAVIERTAGNDLNPFSAVLTQIQLLFHLLSFGPQVRSEGFPAIRIAERANSLVPTSLRDQSTTRWGDIDVPGYSAVVGNPPYLRPERGQPLDDAAQAHFEQPITVGGITHDGISTGRDAYNLFIYRALHDWLEPAAGSSAGDEEGAPESRPGKLAFIIPLGFCAAEKSADLRRLFAPGGRWTITEIVDMELIWRHVFDARVLPMILFAEARPPKETDTVCVRHADDTSVIPSTAGRKTRPSFDLSISPETHIAYADLFTPEGRIATRTTAERAPIISKLRSLSPLSEAAKQYWTRRKGGFQAVDIQPTGIGEAQWTAGRMISDGVARRGTGSENNPDGVDIYKGENIRTAGLVGAPVFRGLDAENLSTPSFWREGLRELLSSRVWCLPILEQIPVAAPLDPKTQAVTNTATVFVPRPDLEKFPFDLLLTSRLYGWVTLLSLRASYQDMLRSHLYPSLIGSLPWSEDVAAVEDDLEALRAPFLDACRARFEAGRELERQAAALALVPLKKAFKANAAKSDKLVASAAFDDGEPALVALQPEDPDDPLTVTFSENGHALAMPNELLAKRLRLGLALAQAKGSEITKGTLPEIPVPEDASAETALSELLARLDPIAVESEVQARVDEIDQVVGLALGLTVDEIAFIEADMREDPFLSRVRPRYPYFTPAQRGRRTSLEQSSRYG
ncbi:N-6 DNA methylase [Erythrobacter vulgaris]|uniref:site-specific DNA-methyltransferase (adenine-specific) n=1 Tax=Qipengyuania vulgaris TaxID=291985 RepID=A0A844XTA4_9SPHN|nr:N-6 DNA methylase [Qipengyuania vulgaris]MXO48930.1 N-6 DNA methylase [Qipengyuania vulgaris]